MTTIAFSLLAVGVVVLAARASLVFINKSRFEAYWQRQMHKPAGDSAIHLVVFGDSIAIGSGASSPRHSLVGLASDYIEQRTGRAVKIENYAIFGGTADMVLEKLPLANLQQADVILLEIGANDSFKRTPDQYRQAMSRIFDILPLHKTVVADLPYVKLRQQYQEILEQILADKQVVRAKASELFHFKSRRASLAVTAGDFFHPNNKGYKLWFAAFKPGIDTVLQRHKLLKTEKK